jgi:hypothetical protein
MERVDLFYDALGKGQMAMAASCEAQGPFTCIIIKEEKMLIFSTSTLAEDWVNSIADGPVTVQYFFENSDKDILGSDKGILGPILGPWNVWICSMTPIREEQNARF